MKWITTPNVHFDRVASAWVIKRFIDPDAEFLFEAKGEESKRPADATPFSIPGTKLGPHDENGPTFAKVVREYKLTDPAIDMIVKVVEDGIGYFMNDYRPKPDDRLGQIAVGYLAFSDGMILVEQSDQKRIDASLVAYDALYTAFKANKQQHA